jgi:transposase InsO family protein
MITISATDTIEFQDGTKHRLVERDGNYGTLQNLATGAQRVMHFSELKLSAVNHERRLVRRDPRAMDRIPPEHLADVQMWVIQLDEILTGINPKRREPSPTFDIATTSQNQRVLAKVSEMNALGIKISRAGIYDKMRAYRDLGPAGLIDSRKDRRATVYGNLDADLVEIIQHVVASRINMPTVSTRRIIELVERELLKIDAEGRPKRPSDATMYRAVKKLAHGKHLNSAATTRRSADVSTKDTFRRRRQCLPGLEVQIDSTVADIFVLTSKGEIVRPTLTVMIDVATRTIIASTIRLVSAKGYDHVLLLGQALVPYANKPDRSITRKLVSLARPELALLSPEAKYRAESARPMISPARIHSDNGKDFLSEVFHSACAQFGIDVSLAPIANGSAKGIVERTFKSINQLFFSSLPGYLANTPANRGLKPEGEDLLSITALTELFDDWVANVWQNRPHEALTDFHEPGIKYSPNEWFAMASDYAPELPISFTTDDYIELLPVVFHAITNEGIRLRNRFYNSPELLPYRDTQSGDLAHNNKWEIHYNPYDMGQVWLRSSSGDWIECPWRDKGVLSTPHAADIISAGRNKKELDAKRAEHARESAELTGMPMPIATRKAIEAALPADVELGEGDLFDIED